MPRCILFSIAGSKGHLSQVGRIQVRSLSIDFPSCRLDQGMLTLWICYLGEEFAIAVLLFAKYSAEHKFLSSLHSRNRMANAFPFVDHSLANGNASDPDV